MGRFPRKRGGAVARELYSPKAGDGGPPRAAAELDDAPPVAFDDTAVVGGANSGSIKESRIGACISCARKLSNSGANLTPQSDERRRYLCERLNAARSLWPIATARKIWTAVVVLVRSQCNAFVKTEVSMKALLVLTNLAI